MMYTVTRNHCENFNQCCNLIAIIVDITRIAEAIFMFERDCCLYNVSNTVGPMLKGVECLRCILRVESQFPWNDIIYSSSVQNWVPCFETLFHSFPEFSGCTNKSSQNVRL